MNLQRVHRSELDDTKRRDLARQEARLGEDLKTVERARHVMMKSHDSEKLLFIKSGAPSNTKVNKTQGLNVKLNTRSSRFVSDTRLKRPSFADQGDIDGQTSNGTHGITPRAERLGPGPAEQTGPTHTTEASYYDTTSVYDRFFEANTGMAAPKRGSRTFTDEGGIKQSAPLANTPPAAPTTNGANSVKDVTPERINRSSQLGPAIDDPDSENEAHETVAAKEYRHETKRPSIWETLSIPKHMSTVKSKRSQVEKEFSRPSPSVTVGKGKPAGGQRLLLLQNGSDKKSMRHPGIPKGSSSNDKLTRNDT